MTMTTTITGPGRPTPRVNAADRSEGAVSVHIEKNERKTERPQLPPPYSPIKKSGPTVELAENQYYAEDTLYATTTMNARSILCTRGSDSFRPSKFVMFQVSGGIGMILFYLAWSDLFYRMRGIKHGPIMSWTVAYAASVLWQHLLNRKLVWTDMQQGYWESLGGMCVVYFFSLILSSLLNVLFVEVLSIAANFAFFVTAVFTGAINYVVIAKCAVAENGVSEEYEEVDDKERDPDERDHVVELAENMVAGIHQLELPIPEVEYWGKKIQQVTKQTAKHWSGQEKKG